MTRHRVTRNAGALGIVQVVNYAASFVVLIHLTRVLGVDTYGVVAFSVGITQLAAVVLDLGFAMSATERIAVHRDNRRFVGRFVGAVLTLKLAAYILGCLAVVAYALTTQKYAAYSALFLLSLIPLLGHALQPAWFFQGIEQMRFVTIFMVVARLSYVVGVVMFVRAESDFLWVPVANGIAQLAAAAVGIYLLHRVGFRVLVPRLRELRYAWRRTRGFLWSRTAATLQANSGVLLLGLAAAPATVALYSLAEQLYRAMHAVFAPITHALYPYMAQKRDLRLLARVTMGCVMVAVLGSVIGHLIAPLMLPPLLGEEWRPALAVLDVFFVAIVVHAAVLMAGYPLAAALGRLDVANRAVLIATALHLAMASLLLAVRAATPVAFAWLLVASEALLLSYTAWILLPVARQQRALESMRPDIAGAFPSGRSHASR